MTARPFATLIDKTLLDWQTAKVSDIDEDCQAWLQIAKAHQAPSKLIEPKQQT
jgi:hypothetical protein